jgi:5-methylcytosine-specific restriction protein A
MLDYGPAWRALRLVVLAEEPLCRECMKKGVLTLATEVDHIIPIVDGGGVLDRSNLQPLCKPCHSRKTMLELRRARPWTTQVALTCSSNR